MRKWNNNRKIPAFGALILTAAFVVSLTPWYRAYAAYDHLWTCAKFRKTIEWNYAHILEDGRTRYAAGSEELLVQTIGETYDAVDIEVQPCSAGTSASCYAIYDVCRDGGVILVTMDDQGGIAVTCDAEGHSVDYTELDEFRQSRAQ